MLRIDLSRSVWPLNQSDQIDPDILTMLRKGCERLRIGRIRSVQTSNPTQLDWPGPSDAFAKRLRNVASGCESTQLFLFRSLSRPNQIDPNSLMRLRKDCEWAREGCARFRINLARSVQIHKPIRLDFSKPANEVAQRLRKVANRSTQVGLDL